MVEELNVRFRGQVTIDELLLHPREAILFCDNVRSKFGYYLVPDDVILRPMMRNRPKESITCGPSPPARISEVYLKASNPWSNCHDTKDEGDMENDGRDSLIVGRFGWPHATRQPPAVTRRF